MHDRYEPANFEARWRRRWQDADLFKTREEPGRPKFYALDFFPYPSGAGLSVGHCRNYVPTDVLARTKRMQGYNVLHPMGFDAFGLPAENEAILRKTHPEPMIEQYAANYRRQMDLVGISFDWSRSFKSSDPRYYRWTQWIFKLLHGRGLAYRRPAEVNWCPKDKTALANEEVVGGLCERCGTPVERRAIPQWFFRITAYAEPLLEGLDKIDWPEGIKAMQRQWIGRSEGVQFRLRWGFHGAAQAPQTPVAPGTDPELASLMAEVEAEGAAPDEASLAAAAARRERLEAAASSAMLGAEFEEAAATVSRYGKGFEVLKTADHSFEVFTTRVDTIFGMTFCVLAPEHPAIPAMLQGVDPETAEAVRAYCERAKRLSEAARTDEEREKTGVFSGVYAVNPANGRTVPVWIADYVLPGYGTGAVMAVPAGDQRDFEFAQAFGLPVVAIQHPTREWFAAQGRDDYDAALSEYLADPKRFACAFVDKEQPLIQAREYTGMRFEEATRAIGEWMEACGIGERKVHYRLRDWLISRQRFWGCPIPVVYDPEGEPELVPDDALPVMLPEVAHYEPGEDGQSPLAAIPEFVNCTTLDGRLGRRETDTLGGFACSSWYFFRFCDPFNDERAWDPAKAAAWLPVDCYVGGAEHAVMHLLYARFWTKVLYDAGLSPVDEPFQRLVNQGQVLGRTPYRAPREGETLGVGETGVLIRPEEAAALPDDQVSWRWVRMSKSKGNVVTPDEAVEQYGADALRLFLCFVAPFDADVEWDSAGMAGTARFLSRVFRLASEAVSHVPAGPGPGEEAMLRDAQRALHQCIAKVTSDVERLSFNTAVAAMMTLSNRLHELWAGKDALGEEGMAAWRDVLSKFVLLLAPFAPHSADELWEGMGREGFTYDQPFPKADPALAAEDTVTIAVQVNGKLRDTVELASGAGEDELRAAALESPRVREHIEGKEVRRVVVVPGRLVNVVV
jgi:leucyl-tRNA synthetase